MDDSPVNSVIDSTLLSYNHSATGLFRITLDVSGKEAIKHAKLILAQCEDNQTMGLAPITKEAARTKLTDDFIEESKPAKSPQAIEYRDTHKKWPSNTADAVCREKNFYRYLVKTRQAEAPLNYDSAKRILKGICDDIESRAELDTNHDALTTFRGMLADYREFVQDQK